MALTTVGAIFSADVAGEAGGPWWNKRAIHYLATHLRPGDRVFEWGSGGSTVWLTEHGAHVTSVEDNQEWVSKVSDRCPEADLRAIPGTATGTIKSPGGGLGGERLFYDDYVAVIDGFRDGSFAVVIVDGQCRAECFKRAIPKVSPGGMIVLDDSDMRLYAPLKKSLPDWKSVSLAGFKPTRDVRETTFFHRPV